MWDEKATASCRAVRAEQAGNGDSYSNVVKHLPEMCLGLYHFRTWSKERHLWRHGVLKDTHVKCADVSIRLFSSSLVIIVRSGDSI